MSNIVVLGASGQLGNCLKKLAETKGIADIYFPSETEANILDNDALLSVFNVYKPLYCINCAAYTAVDKAEDEPEIALKINKTGVENISRICAANGSVLIHISTDFVFKGDAPTPRDEESPAQPLNVYGKTKLEGEQAVEALLKRYFIIRTGWLYSEFGNNFVKTMLRIGAERNEISVVTDQAGTPTYGMDLAACIMHIIQAESDAYGIYHYSNEGIASWYDFAKAIFDISKTSVRVLPVKTEEYITKAIRPYYSVMDKSKIKNTFNLKIPYWRDSLVSCLNNLKSQIN